MNPADTTGHTEPVGFDRFMNDALYGPHGFYNSGGTAGRRGDFITSPEIGPLFGAIVARFLDHEWQRLGRPDPFTVIDAGAGPGTLARAVLAAEPVCSPALRYVAVEVAASQRSRHPAGVVSAASLPDVPFDGVVIANELLDNLPFRLAVFDDGWREAFVVTLPDGSLVEHLSAPFVPLPTTLPTTALLGARAPSQDQAAAWVAQARALIRRGTLVVFDYCSATTAGLALRPWRDWLRTYRHHQRGGHYLADVGRQDITSEVAVDQLPVPDTVRTQAQWLQLYGVSELVEQGRAHWLEHASHPDLVALKMRSRISEAEALLDPSGLGGFSVLEWAAGD